MARSTAFKSCTARITAVTRGHLAAGKQSFAAPPIAVTSVIFYAERVLVHDESACEHGKVM